MPFSLAAITIGSMPVTGLSSPSSDISAAKRHLSSLSCETKPYAASRPAAMGRSSPELSLRIFAGARFIVTFDCFSLKPEFFTAVLTRSLDSFTAVSRSPTISKLGSPYDTSTSTSTSIPSTPSVTAPLVLANNVSLPIIHDHYGIMLQRLP